MIRLSETEKRLETVRNRFRKNSKQLEAALYIVRHNRQIPMEERKAICKEIPIKYKTLQGVFTELRKIDLYPYSSLNTSGTYTSPPEKPVSQQHVPERPDEPQPHVPEKPILPLPEYATKDDFKTLKNSINYLASVISGEEPSTSGEYSEEETPEVDTPTEIEDNTPEEIFIQDPTLTRHSIWLKTKTQMYFDAARQGTFSNYAGSRDRGPLTQFEGNLSDFFNIIVEDYFIRNYNADVGILQRSYL